MKRALAPHTCVILASVLLLATGCYKPGEETGPAAAGGAGSQELGSAESESGKQGAEGGQSESVEPGREAADAAPDRVYTIGMSQCNLGEPWRVQMDADVRAAAEKHKNLKVVFKDAQNDTLKQRAHVEEYISAGVDLIVISPKEAQPLTEPVAKAMEAGVPVIVLDRALTPGGVGGPLAAETAQMLYGMDKRPELLDYIIGLGGRDMPPDLLIEIYNSAKEEIKKSASERQDFYLMGVRG